MVHVYRTMGAVIWHLHLCECKGQITLMRRVRSILSAAAVCISIALGSAIVAHAQDTTPPDTGTEVVRQDPTVWALDCQSESEASKDDCQVSQSISILETGQRIVMVVVQKDDAGVATHMLLALPHRIYLPSGVDLTVDTNRARRMAFETCDERACYASAQIDTSFIDELRGGEELSVVFHNLADKPVTVPVSLLGFSVAYDQLP